MSIYLEGVLGGVLLSISVSIYLVARAIVVALNAWARLQRANEEMVQQQLPLPTMFLQPEDKP